MCGICGQLNFARNEPVEPATIQRMTETMDRALAAEVGGDYERAKALYLAAAKLDPADPVPARLVRFGPSAFHRVLKTKFGLADR